MAKKKIIKNKEDLKFILLITVIIVVCYLIAFIISHIFGIQDIKVHTPTHGDLSTTTGIFFILLLIGIFLCIR